MKAGCEITEVRAGASGISDGLHVGIKPTGTPVGGTFTVWAALAPDVVAGSRIACAFGANVGGWYEVTLPTPGLWYLWLRDTQGWSDDTPVWTLIDETNSVGEWMRDLLLLHKRGLDLRVAHRYNAIAPTKQQDGRAPAVVTPKVGQITYGIKGVIESWPAIVIDGVARDEPYFATAWCRLVTVNLKITCMIWHTDYLTGLLPAITDLAEGVQHILNNPLYNRFTLPSGVPFAMAEAPRMSSFEDEVNAGWGAEATLEWSAQRVRQQVPQNL